MTWTMVTSLIMSGLTGADSSIWMTSRTEVRMAADLIEVDEVDSIQYVLAVTPVGYRRRLPTSVRDLDYKGSFETI